MHVRVRRIGKPDSIVVVESKLTKIDQFRKTIEKKFGVESKLQRFFYGGKLLENGYTFHDYNIKLNDVIQLLVSHQPDEVTEKPKVKDADPTNTKTDAKEQDESAYTDAECNLYVVGDLVDIRDMETGSWFEGKIVRIVCDTNDKLKYKVLLDSDETEATDVITYNELKHIRPRARTVLDTEDLKVGQTVMINHNMDHTSEKGYWYDFKIDEISQPRKNCKLIGTLYIGPDALPHNTTVKIHDKIFAIDEVMPIADRTEEYKKMMVTPPGKRSLPLQCLTCRDDEDKPCRDCGCYECLGKEAPERIVLCDECNHGFHMDCVKPVLKEIPEDDWYCPMCKRDTNDVVAPGAAKQTKKTNSSKKDWGRGMACVGKSKTCAMPLNHFGPIPGVEVGMSWRFRIQLSETGVHRPPVSGIHGRDVEGAYSIVLSGGYEDDVDNGNEFTYTGSGGRNLSGNKRTAEQSCDQTLTRENKALARNCAVKEISTKGADAGDNWRNGKPVRVVRSYKMLKHFPKYAPKEGIRYDGIYKVVKYYPEKGLSGYIVWKYLLRRDDPNPAPWEAKAKHYPIVYPDGYLEAEAERKKLNKKANGVTKKRALVESSEDGSPPSIKKRKLVDENENRGIVGMFNQVRKQNKAKPEVCSLNEEEMAAVNGDVTNTKVWKECLEVCHSSGKTEFVKRISETFLCIICQDIAVAPVTTSCLHTICFNCLKMAFIKSGKFCPYCRNDLASYTPEVNESLRTALRTIMPGYDAGK